MTIVRDPYKEIERLRVVLKYHTLYTFCMHYLKENN